MNETLKPFFRSHWKRLRTGGWLRPVRRGLTIRRIAKLGMALPALIVVAVILLAEHRPSWHRPLHLSEQGLERARLDAAETWDRISWQIVQAKPFNVVLTDQAVTEWLSALLHHRPELREHIPSNIVNPVLSFAQDELRISVHVERNGWRAIITIGIKPELSADKSSLTCTLGSVHLGSLPLPRQIIEDYIAPSLEQQLNDAPDNKKIGLRISKPQEHLTESPTPRRMPQFTIPNDFLWPNGERPVHAQAISVQPGKLILTLNPYLRSEG